MPPLTVEMLVTYDVRVSTGPAGVQLEVNVTVSVIADPVTVESFVIYEVTVCSGAAGVHEGQDGVSVSVTTLVITLGGELGHEEGV